MTRTTIIVLSFVTLLLLGLFYINQKNSLTNDFASQIYDATLENKRKLLVLFEKEDLKSFHQEINNTVARYSPDLSYSVFILDNNKNCLYQGSFYEFSPQCNNEYIQAMQKFDVSKASEKHAGEFFIKLESGNAAYLYMSIP